MLRDDLIERPQTLVFQKQSRLSALVLKASRANDPRNFNKLDEQLIARAQAGPPRADSTLPGETF